MKKNMYFHRLFESLFEFSLASMAISIYLHQ